MFFKYLTVTCILVLPTCTPWVGRSVQMEMGCDNTGMCRIKVCPSPDFELSHILGSTFKTYPESDQYGASVWLKRTTDPELILNTVRNIVDSWL